MVRRCLQLEWQCWANAITKDNTTGTPKTFPFVRLTPELRNRLYEMILVKPEVIDFTDSGDHTELRTAVQHPALTRTCRQIRTESLAIFYELNTFLTDSQYCFCGTQSWIQVIGPQNRSRLKQLYVDFAGILQLSKFLTEIGLTTYVQLT